MKTEYQNEVIARLKALHEKNGFSQLDIATYLGISPGQLGNIESYKRPHKYTLKQIYLLCTKFGIEIPQVFCSSKHEASTSLIHALIFYCRHPLSCPYYQFMCRYTHTFLFSWQSYGLFPNKQKLKGIILFYLRFAVPLQTENKGL